MSETPRMVAYLRKSVIHRTTNGVTGDESWEAQDAAVRRLASSLGEGNLSFLSDWGQSGAAKNDKRRPGWQKLLSQIDAREVDLLLAYDEQRLSRSVLSLLDLYRRCDAAGVKVVLAQGGLVDFHTAAGRFKLTILAGVAEYQSAQGSERSQDLADRRRARGEKLGDFRYGDDPRHPEHDPLAVLAAYQESGSFERAARLLNERGVPAHRGGQWHGRTVAMVVRFRSPELVRKTLTRGSRIVSGHRFGGLVICPCGGRMRGAAKASRPGHISYSCYRASTLPGHPRPATLPEYRLRRLAMLEGSRFRPGDGTAADLALTEAKRIRSLLVDLYLDARYPKSELDERFAAATVEIERLEAILFRGAWTWQTYQFTSDEDPVAYNKFLRERWVSITTGYVDGKLQPLRAIWKDGVVVGPPDPDMVNVVANSFGSYHGIGADGEPDYESEESIAWLKAAGWLPPDEPPTQVI